MLHSIMLADLAVGGAVPGRRSRVEIRRDRAAPLGKLPRLER